MIKQIFVVYPVLNKNFNLNLYYWAWFYCYRKSAKKTERILPDAPLLLGFVSTLPPHYCPSWMRRSKARWPRNATRWQTIRRQNFILISLGKAQLNKTRIIHTPSFLWAFEIFLTYCMASNGLARRNLGLSKVVIYIKNFKPKLRLAKIIINLKEQ